MKLLTTLAVVVALLTGCSWGEAAKAEEQFLEGREMVQFYEMALPGDFDAVDYVNTLGSLFGIDDRVSTVDDDQFDVSVGTRGGSTAGLNLQTLEWGFDSSILTERPGCRGCAEVSISHDDAVARVTEILDRTGARVDDIELIAETAPNTFRNAAPGELEVVKVTGTASVDGRPSHQRWRFEFGDGDNLLIARGSAALPIPAGVVPLLTPEEAFAAENLRLGRDPDVDETDLRDVELAWLFHFDRASTRGFLVPGYLVPIDADLDLDRTIPAIRPEDFPDR